MTGEGPQGGQVWSDALSAAALFAADPASLKGVVLRASAGPVRERWLDHLRSYLPGGQSLRRLPASIADDRLFGGLDLAASLKAGRPVVARGLLAEADGGFLLLAMAERVEADLAGRLAAALDQGAIELERDGFRLSERARFGLVALDEGADASEAAPAALAERLAFHLDLSQLGLRDLEGKGPDAMTVAAARALLSGSEREPFRGEEEAAEAFCAGAVALGVDSLRAPYFALRAARAAAALKGLKEIGEAEIGLAARLVLAPRATRLPSAPPEEEEQAPPEEAEQTEQNEESKARDEEQPFDELVVEAALASLPPDLLASLASSLGGKRKGPAGRSGSKRQAEQRGRPIGARPGEPGGGKRLDLLATLRAAAPWQGLRKRETLGAERDLPVQVRREDFRIARRKARSRNTTIMVVDASGSSALQRLAEVKGAAELLLAESYVRRDQVALIAFRGEAAELLLPPTRSLARARRELASLPGGGATPLAAALLAAVQLGESLQQRAETPLIVLMTDGRGNIALDGTADRKRAQEDAVAMARTLQASRLRSVLIDSGARKERRAEELAQAMGARYLHLPFADAGSISRQVAAL